MPEKKKNDKEQKKKKVGRPKKNKTEKPKRPRGRPRKNAPKPDEAIPFIPDEPIVKEESQESAIPFPIEDNTLKMWKGTMEEKEEEIAKTARR